MSERPSVPARGKPRADVGPERTNAEWLAELAADGGDAAAEDLRAYLRRKLRGTLGRRGLGDADLEDVLQDALIRILRHRDSFRGDSRFTTWAMAIAIREAFALLRRRRREHLLGDVDPTSLDAALVAEGGHRGGAERRSILGVLRTAIAEQLTERQRAAILGELAGVPTEELARRLGTNRNALYKLHHDARRRLRSAILDAGYSEEEVRLELASASEET